MNSVNGSHRLDPFGIRVQPDMRSNDEKIARLQDFVRRLGAAIWRVDDKVSEIKLMVEQIQESVEGRAIHVEIGGR